MKLKVEFIPGAWKETNQMMYMIWEYVYFLDVGNEWIEWVVSPQTRYDPTTALLFGDNQSTLK